jgi:hypothetical protein
VTRRTPNTISSGLALRLARLALDPSAWINRRVERVTYLDESTVRRFISVDFTVPSGPTDASVAVDFVPLALFAKEKLTNFDLRDGQGAALPMLTAAENGRLSSGILLAVAQARLGLDFDSLSEKYIPRLVFSTAMNESERELALARILQPGTAAGQRILEHPELTTLAVDFADNFMLYLPMTGNTPGQRLVVKIAYDSPRNAPRVSGALERLGWRPATDGFDVPPTGYGASYHFELEAPPEMEVAYGRFFATRNGKLIHDTLDGPVRRAHFNLADVDRGFGQVWIGLKARSSELLGGAALFAFVNFAALIFVRARLHHIVTDPGVATTSGGGTEPAVAALLAIPAVLIGYLLRPGEHEILSAFIALPRLAALGSALTALLAAALLFGGYSAGTLGDLYLALAGMAGACALVVGASWLGQRR